MDLEVEVRVAVVDQVEDGGQEVRRECLDSHEQVLRKAGVDREVIQESFKIASIVQAIGVTLDAEAILAD